MQHKRPYMDFIHSRLASEGQVESSHLFVLSVREKEETIKSQYYNNINQIICYQNMHAMRAKYIFTLVQKGLGVNKYISIVLNDNGHEFMPLFLYYLSECQTLNRSIMFLKNVCQCLSVYHPWPPN